MKSVVVICCGWIPWAAAGAVGAVAGATRGAVLVTAGWMVMGVPLFHFKLVFIVRRERSDDAVHLPEP
ncbi:MAG: hypothetical protein ACRD22_11205, partial [Terriglobia bacterium]